MKPSSTWFALILIASALLVSATKSASGEQSGKQNTSKVEGYSGEGRSTDPIATRINQPTAYSTSTEGGRVTYNYNGDFKYVAPPPSPESDLKQAGDIASVLSTIAVAFFTGLLWNVSKQQKTLMEDAEEISRRSVETAEKSLDIYRPFLLVTDIVVEPKQSDYKSEADIQLRHHFYVHVAIKNFGVSPADITDYTVAVEPLDPPKRPNFIDPSVWYEDVSQLNDSIISPGERIPDRINTGNSLTDLEYESLLSDKKRLAIYGRIRYRGASQKIFETFFYWWCFLTDPANPQLLRCNTKKWNDHT
jgi:hypothetical protein